MKATMFALYLATANAAGFGKVGATDAVGYGTDITGCYAFAATFDNSCSATTSTGKFDTAWTSTSAWVGKDISCASSTYSGYTSSSCPGTWVASSSSCTVSHKLCVTCATSGSDVYIRIQTNWCPRRCGNGASASYTCAWTSDWKVKWQPSVGTAASPTRIATSGATVGTTSLTDAMFTSTGNFCKLSDSPLRYDKIPTNSGWDYSSISGTNYYTGGSGSGYAAQHGGVGLDGGAIAGYVSGTGVDPFYPNPYSSSTVEGTDGTLSHPDPDGILHYHATTPFLASRSALATTTNGKPFGVCSTKMDGAYVSTTSSGTKTYCFNYNSVAASATASQVNMANYIPAAFTAAGQNKAQPIGLARDGHIIYGPYDSTGALFQGNTKVDACNGAFTTDGTYVYVAQTTWPYIVGCFGPPTQTDLTTDATPVCSTNARTVKKTHLDYTASKFSNAYTSATSQANSEEVPDGGHSAAPATSASLLLALGVVTTAMLL